MVAVGWGLTSRCRLDINKKKRFKILGFYNSFLLILLWDPFFSCPVLIMNQTPLTMEREKGACMDELKSVAIHETRLRGAQENNKQQTTAVHHINNTSQQVSLFQIPVNPNYKIKMFQ